MRAEDSLFLFGPEKEISAGITEAGESLDDYIIVDCSQTLEMGERPCKIISRKNRFGIG